MGKFKTITNLAKLNHKLGLLDAGDVVSLASTAYKVKNFSPTDHLPDFELDFWERNEIEKEQRRNAILAAAVIGTGAYLISKNRSKSSEFADDTKYNSRKIARDARRTGEDILEAGKDIAEDAKEKGEDMADDIKDKSKEAKKKGERFAHDAKKKGEDIADDVADKGKDIKDDAKEKVHDEAEDVAKKTK